MMKTKIVQPLKFQAFTLIELAVVLVIIGLIAGGVMVGLDMIKAAGVRAQVNQIQQFQTAVHTFKLKYNALPGDISSASAAQSGLVSRSGNVGYGDGNGLIGIGYPKSDNQYFYGEMLLFWRDLSAAGLIDDSFNFYTSGQITTVATNADFSRYLPKQKIGNENGYILVYSYNGAPYFEMRSLDHATNSFLYAPGFENITPNEGYNIDVKIDDGMCRTGTVTANFDNPYFGATSCIRDTPRNYNMSTTEIANSPICTGLRFDF